MKKYDWLSKIKTCTLLLQLCGLWPAGDSYRLNLYAFQAATLLSVFYLGHVFVQAVNIYFIRNNLTAVTGTIYILLIEILGMCKFYLLIKNMRMLKQLLKMLDTDIFQPKNATQIKAIETNIWYWKVIYSSYMGLGLGGDLFWNIYPLMDETDDRRLPFLAWYPFDTTTSPAYEIAYIYQLIAIIFITIAHVTMDGLATALSVFAGSQFDLLSDNLRNLHQLGNISASIVKCVEHHRRILRYVDQCNNFLNWIVFAQFFVSAIALGLTMFQLTLVIPMSSEFFSFVVYGLSVCQQTFIHCWVGNEIEVKSNQILYAVFESEWTNFPIVCQKDLLFLTLRVQKPVRLSALNLFYLSLDTFIRILKTSWSYFALLNQVNSKK